MIEIVKEQILAIRDTGQTNMFDTPTVQRLAFESDFLSWWISSKISERPMSISFSPAR